MVDVRPDSANTFLETPVLENPVKRFRFLRQS
jgi:hypothetical protein